MVPSLAVAYDSFAEQGMFGRRWDLSGLSEISRCDQTIANDGKKGPIDPKVEAFCLDGVRLVRVSGQAFGTGDFIGKKGSGTKIRLTTAADGRIAFNAYHADGEIWSYGATSASRQLEMPVAESGSSDPGALSWKLDRMEDRYQNAVVVTYTDKGGHALDSSNDWYEEALVPLTITWGGSGTTRGLRSASFVYNPHGSVTRSRTYRHLSDGSVLQALTVKRIDLSGPSGQDATDPVILKSYKFSYLSGVNTGSTLLDTVSECESPTGACKQPVSVGWEAGDPNYDRVDTGIAYSVGQRAHLQDLDADGFDDLVITTMNDDSQFGFQDLGKVTLYPTSSSHFTQSSSPLPPLLGTPQQLWPRPGTPALHFAYLPLEEDPWVGVRFVDLLHRGYLDMLIPSLALKTMKCTWNDRYYLKYNIYSAAGGHPGERGVWSNTPQGPYLELYDPWPSSQDGAHRCNANPVQGKFTTGPWVNVPGFNDTEYYGDSFAAVGDTDGNGYAELIRTGKRGTVQQLQSLQPPMGQYVDIHAEFSQTWTPNYRVDPTQHFPANALLDLDGAGVAAPTPLTSDDMSDAIHVIALGMSGQRVDTFPIAMAGCRIRDRGNLRTVDVNLDGIEDVVTVGDGALERSNAPAHTKLRAYLGRGIVPTRPGAGHREVFSSPDVTVGGGTANVLDLPIPIGQWTEIAYIANGPDCILAHPKASGGTEKLTGAGFQSSVFGDVNNDGLPDLVQLENNHYVYYLRRGIMPDLVTKISDGGGKRQQVWYQPFSRTSAPPPSCSGAGCDHATKNGVMYISRGPWLVKSILTKAGDINEHRDYSFLRGVADFDGKPLGFEEIDMSHVDGVDGSVYSQTQTHFDRSQERFSFADGSYEFPEATVATSLVRTTFLENSKTDVVTTTYDPEFEVSSLSANAGLHAFRVQVQTSHKDCVAATCETLGVDFEQTSFDAFGNVSDHSLIQVDGKAGGILQTDMVTNSYLPADSETWLVSRLDSQAVTSSARGETSGYTVSYTSDPSTGAVSSMEIDQANPGASDHLLLSVSARDRGRPKTITALANGFDPRTTTFNFDDADGVYPSSVENALGQTRIWRHPGYGFVIGVDDPNGIGSALTFDTFGRVTREERPIGFTTFNHHDELASHVDGRMVTSAQNASITSTTRFDPAGLVRFTDVPGGKLGARLRLARGYDRRGHLISTLLSSGTWDESVELLGPPPFRPIRKTAQVVDTLGRVTLACRSRKTSSDVGCSNVDYQGLVARYTSEANETVTRTFDPAGRLLNRTSAEGSSVNYKYGPFGRLRHEIPADGSGQTDLAYDAFGHLIESNRPHAGVTRHTYNGFGEPWTTVKVDGSGAELATEKLTFNRDALGRVTTIMAGLATAPAREFVWDQGPNALGRLSQAKATTALGDVTEAFYYDEAGQPWGTTWSVPGNDPLWLSREYDDFGRLWKTTYPKLPWESAADVISNAYDAAGRLTSLTSAASGTVWQVGERTDWGDPTVESVPAFSSMGRTTTFFNDGRPSSVALGTQASAAFDYDPVGRLTTLTISGSAVPAHVSAFGYDSLNELSVWIGHSVNGVPFTPSVRYDHDMSGSVSTRSWQSSDAMQETVSYLWNGNSQIVSTAQTNNGVASSWSDQYARDPWGRVNSTPLLSAAYDAFDQLIAVTKSGEATANLGYDALGHRTVVQNSDGSQSIDLDGEMKLEGSAGLVSSATIRLVSGLELVRNAGGTSAVMTLTGITGDVIAEQDPTGTVTARSTKDPYGNPIADLTQPFLPAESATGGRKEGLSTLSFGDHESNPNWGLIDMGARAYSPRLGSMLAADAVIGDLEDPLSFNPFTYALGNPTNNVDPTGNSTNSSGAGEADGPGGGGDGLPGPGGGEGNGGPTVPLPTPVEAPGAKNTTSQHAVHPATYGLVAFNTVLHASLLGVEPAFDELNRVQDISSLFRRRTFSLEQARNFSLGYKEASATHECIGSLIHGMRGVYGQSFKGDGKTFERLVDYSGARLLLITHGVTFAIKKAHGEETAKYTGALPHDVILKDIGQEDGFHLFAISIGAGYHTASVAVERNGKDVQFYWFDQNVRGSVSADYVDARILLKTQGEVDKTMKLPPGSDNDRSRARNTKLEIYRMLPPGN